MNIFGVEHGHTTVPLPHGGVQHTFHLPNGVTVSAVRAAYIDSSGAPAVRELWEVYAWREGTDDNDVFLSGADMEGVVNSLTTDQVGERLREAAALPKAGA
jgi:hypothetical protein